MIVILEGFIDNLREILKSSVGQSDFIFYYYLYNNLNLNKLCYPKRWAPFVDYRKPKFWVSACLTLYHVTTKLLSKGATKIITLQKN